MNRRTFLRAAILLPLAVKVCPEVVLSPAREAVRTATPDEIFALIKANMERAVSEMSNQLAVMLYTSGQDLNIDALYHAVPGPSW